MFPRLSFHIALFLFTANEKKEGTLDEGELPDASPADDEDLVARQVLGCKHGHCMSVCMCDVVMSEGQRRKGGRKVKKRKN